MTLPDGVAYWTPAVQNLVSAPGLRRRARHPAVRSPASAACQSTAETDIELLDGEDESGVVLALGKRIALS